MYNLQEEERTKRPLETGTASSASKRSKNRNENHKPRGPLAEAIVNGQRVSKIWNEAWKLWVTTQANWSGRHGTPPCDPARWSPERLKIFFDELGMCFLEMRGNPSQQYLGPPQRGPECFGPPMRNYEQPIDPNFRQWGRQPAPRGNTGTPFGPGLGPRGGFTDPLLIQFIKDGQRNSPSFKEFWSQHCQEHGGGTFDPNKHATPFFIGCALCYGVDKLIEEDWTKPYLGAVGLAGQPLLARVIKNGQHDEFKESWTKFVEQKGGKTDPTTYDPQTLFEFMGTVGMNTYKVPELLEKLAEIN